MSSNAPDTAPKPGLLKSAGIVSAAIATSRLTGLVRESILSSLFGAGATYDAYVLGFRIPSLARELFAEGALSSAFIPTFTRFLTTRSREEARELSNITGTMVLVATGAFCALGMLFAPLIVHLFAPGFQAVPGKTALAVTLVRTMFPFLLLLALSAQAQGIHNATHSFFVPAVSSALFNIASVTSGLILGYWIGPHIGLPAIHGMAYGILFGGAAQLGVQLPGVWRAGFRWRPRWNLRENLRNEGLRQILTLMGPAVIGSASGQINILVNTNFAAGLTDAAGHVMNGPVSWLAYAYRFFGLPMGVFGVAIASAALPRLSRSAALADFQEFRDTLARSIIMIMLLTVPASVGLVLLGESMIAIVYQHGRFLPYDTHQTALALSCYAVGLAAYAGMKLIAPAFYALGDARTPALVSLASVAVNAVTAFTLVKVVRTGQAGLALSTSVVATFSAIALLLLLRRKIGGIRGPELLLNGMKVSIAAAAMGVVCWLVVRESHAVFTGSSARVTDIVLGIPAGAASFYAAARALRVEELADATESVLRRFRAAV